MPATTPVTSTEIVQVSLAPNPAVSAKMIVDVPAAAVMSAGAIEPQVSLTLGVAAINKPGGRVSWKVTLVNTAALGLVRSKVNVVVAP